MITRACSEEGKQSLSNNKPVTREIDLFCFYLCPYLIVVTVFDLWASASNLNTSIREQDVFWVLFFIGKYRLLLWPIFLALGYSICASDRRLCHCMIRVHFIQLISAPGFRTGQPSSMFHFIYHFVLLYFSIINIHSPEIWIAIQPRSLLYAGVVLVLLLQV